MAVEMLEKISADEIMRQKYLDREQARIDRKSAIYYAEQKGIEKGIEKGKILMIKNMLQKNPNIEMISELTGVLIKELEKIKEQL